MAAPTIDTRPGAETLPVRLNSGVRRALIALSGAALAFGGGVGVAYAFRVSPDMAATADPQDMTVQDELPSITAARTYALNNPPAYAAPASASPITETETAAATAQDLSAPSLDEAEIRRPADTDQAEEATPAQPQPYRAAFKDQDGLNGRAPSQNAPDPSN